VVSSEKRTRGPNKRKPWSRNPDDGVTVLRLALDTSDPRHRARIEAMFEGAYTIKRALQRGARDKCRAYWTATHERAKDPDAVRRRLGLSQDAFEDAAFAHIDAAPHLRRYVTKAFAQNLADAVWSGVERHLFRDKAGKRHGLPRVGRWFDFTRLPGRARSHTTPRKWETYRLHGTLAGHRAAYTDRDGDFVQPRRMRPVNSDRWWSYEGPLAIVFSGLADGTLVLPVRLPTAPSNQAFLEHHLADPSRWHKIDLVRRRDANASGGWRYEAHLMVLAEPYVSPATAVRRMRAAVEGIDRTAGIDINVSNLTIASHERGTAMQLTRVERDKPRERASSRRERRRRRALDRSRRSTNRAQYQLSKRQEKRARRRAAAGLPPVDAIPMGPRKARTDGVPLQSYRRDELSASYQRLRAIHAVRADADARLRRDLARQTAAQIVARHGYQVVVEDCNVTAWARTWGRALAAFSPASLLAAVDREARAVARLAGRKGGVTRVSTRTTALSQHCPCGARVDKTLADRIHACPSCGLHGDRDSVAAVLASFVDATSAGVDYVASATALDAIRRILQPSPYDGWQDTLSESTDLSTRDGSFVAWSMSAPDSVEVARRTSARHRVQPGMRLAPCQTTSERARVRTDMSRWRVPRVALLRGTPLTTSS
jgi:hypothetical protein